MPEFIEIDINDRKLKAALARMHARLRDLRPFMKIAGNILTESTKDRFQSQTDPSGKPWKPLNPVYAARKRKNRGRILTLTGLLGDTIHYQLRGKDTVLVGSSLPYAAIHQLGGQTDAHVIRPKNKRALFWPGAAHPVRKVNHPGSNIPARPYLGVSEGDRVRLLEEAEDYLAKALEPGTND